MMNCAKVENHKCASCNTNKIITAQEKGRIYRLNNPSGKKFCKVQIDGCYIDSKQGKRCDYLIIDCERNGFYFVELKGKDLLTAVEQIDQTISYFEGELNGTVYARIVLTKVSVPNIENNPKILKLRRRLKQLSGNLTQKSRQLEETI
jgi:hypothetical protein